MTINLINSIGTTEKSLELKKLSKVDAKWSTQNKNQYLSHTTIIQKEMHKSSKKWWTLCKNIKDYLNKYSRLRRLSSIDKSTQIKIQLKANVINSNINTKGRFEKLHFSGILRFL